MAGSLGMEAPRLLAALRRQWWLVGAITLVAIVAAVAVSQSQAAGYQASAVLLFRTTSADSLLAGGGTSSSSSITPQDQATDLALASLDTVAARVRQQLGWTVTVEKLKSAVSIQLKGNSNLVTVTASWSKPREAAAIANAFAQQIIAFRRETAQAEVQQSIDAINNTISTQGALLAGGSRGSPAANPNEISSLRNQVSQLEALKARQTGDVQIVEPATPPPTPSSPRPARNAVIAAFVGLTLGILVVLLLGQFDQRIRDESELTALLSAPVLARIPKLPGSKRFGHTSSVRRDDAFLEAFEFLRLNLQLTVVQQGPLVVAVTSPAAGDGKTTVVASLARSLALSGADVVAVDFDLRNPMLHLCFDVPQESARGVLDALLDTGERDDLAQATEYPELRVLAAGRHPLRPGLIAHERVQFMLAQLRDGADYIVVDTSPISIGADASAVVAAADYVILVIDLKRIRRRDLLAAKRQLAIAHRTILGIVVNRAGADIAAYHPRERAAATMGETSPPTFSE